mgnify:CR=1 FL=1
MAAGVNQYGQQGARQCQVGAQGQALGDVVGLHALEEPQARTEEPESIGSILSTVGSALVLAGIVFVFARWIFAKTARQGLLEG